MFLANGPKDLPGRLVGYPGLPETAENQVRLVMTAVPVQRLDGHAFNVPAAISFDDLRKIPVPQRTEAAIGRAVARLMNRFFKHRRQLATCMAACRGN